MSIGVNPIIWADFPDVDIIRVEDTYYMASTTMHMMPGGAILRSYDLIHWEMASYLYDTLDSTPAQRLEDGQEIYGKGMWAPCLKYHQGKFYVVFAALDTHTTYLYTATSAEGPWEKSTIEGFYHDASILFDDDGRAYIVYGNREIRLTELETDLRRPKPGGLDRVLLTDTDEYRLGFEGSHLYKIGGKYYLFMIHWPIGGNARRTEACYVADSLEGEFTGRDVLDDDMGYHNAGVAQGGIVDTPEGDWYAMLFQDHGAVGRIPVLVPVRWQDDFPVFGIEGRVPVELSVPSTRPGCQYAPLAGSDDFRYAPGERLKMMWQWNHDPVEEGYSLTERPGHLRLRTTNVTPNLVRSRNTLTQRTFGPTCEVSVMLDGSGLGEGDSAGLCLLMSHYGCVALTKREGGFCLEALETGAKPEASRPGRPDWIRGDDQPSRVVERTPISSPQVEVMACFDFRDNIDVAQFYYKKDGEWTPIGERIQMVYRMDHFMGCRVGLFCYSTEQSGGYADFSAFQYRIQS